MAYSNAARAPFNSIRAQLALTPETNDHTSIQARIGPAKEANIPSAVATFQGSERKDEADGIPFALRDYIELDDVSGRAIRDDKLGHIENSFQPLLKKLKNDAEIWLHTATTFEACLVGAA